MEKWGRARAGAWEGLGWGKFRKKGDEWEKGKGLVMGNVKGGKRRGVLRLGKKGKV